MKNSPLQLALNVVLLLAVGVLFYLHFASKPAAPAPAAATTATPPPMTAPDSAAQEANEAPAADAKPAAPAPAAVEDNVRKVAYVESTKLLDSYKGLQDARRAFEKKAAVWEQKHRTAVQSLQNAVQSYQKMAPSMTDEQRATAEGRLQQQEQQVAQQQQQLQQQAQQEEAKMTESVLTKVNKLLEVYGKENNYDLILVAGGGSIAYARQGLNITDIVLKRLNADYAAGRK
ncbi:OmpH family outer membrane protein [Hymenobacter sp. 15J16-1T3B]|uniref:OmpH family outer membrane protein n=1 Tax=Hymenobacter sp. 15J16-1T3B TaxID=2886941 RepID=UPI001D11AA52|nr:OmpH family outer membrane protein [Hymenobacter sp. 15J16-1T3B]MCC3158118.1 OmpH family outer membrane protein [Hymenobacter sp. 15J16-1T3B]